ncbi:TPA: fimbrial protein [Escherichia coli]
MLKRSQLSGLIAAGLLFTSIQVLAVDVPIKIVGTIQIPPCQVNNGEMIEVNLGDISVTDVENKRNQRKISVPVTCRYAQGTAYIKITGTPLGKNTNVLVTNVDNFGIALYQGDGTITKLVLGDGKYNGQNSIGYPIETGLTGKESGTFTFTAAPYKEENKDLTAVAFTASANMNISYF